jgi:IS1 family transposase
VGEKEIKKENVEILEIDEIVTQIKKVKNGGKYTFTWIVVDRNRNKVIDFELRDRTKKTYFRLYHRITRRYDLNYLCTDGLDVSDTAYLTLTDISQKSIWIKN